MFDWVCGSLIPRLHLTTLLRRLRLQTNLYYADSGSKSFTLDLLRRDTHWAGTGKSGSVGISFPQLEFPKRNPGSSREETLRLGATLLASSAGCIPVADTGFTAHAFIQAGHYITSPGADSTAQTRAPNKSLLRRLGLQIIYSRWQQPYWDAFASLFYSGRKRRPIVHLFLQSMEGAYILASFKRTPHQKQGMSQFVTNAGREPISVWLSCRKSCRLKRQHLNL